MLNKNKTHLLRVNVTDQPWKTHHHVSLLLLLPCVMVLVAMETEVRRGMLTGSRKMCISWLAACMPRPPQDTRSICCPHLWSLFLPGAEEMAAPVTCNTREMTCQERDRQAGRVWEQPGKQAGCGNRQAGCRHRQTSRPARYRCWDTSSEGSMSDLLGGISHYAVQKEDVSKLVQYCVGIENILLPK